MVAHRSAGPASEKTVPEKDKESQDSSNNLEREFAAYRKALASGATEEEIAAAAARIAAAAAHRAATGSADTHKEPPPTYQPAPSQEGCDPQPDHSSDSDTSSSKGDSDSPGKQIGKGALLIVATPFALAGTVIQSAGVIVGGVAMLLKGIGSIGRKPLERVIEGSKKKSQN